MFKIDNNGKTSLFYACRNGKEAIIKILVEYGVDINTSLFETYDTGNVDIVKYRGGNKSIVKSIVDHMKNKNKNNNDNDNEAKLFEACRIGNESEVKYLVEQGADVNNEDCYGRTPIFNACINGNKAIVEYLVERGADINIENGNGEIPIFVA